MKKIYKIAVLLCGLSAFASCSKEDKLNYNLQNYDTFEPGEIDKWITTNLTDPYNIEVIYRYQRNMHDINKNISPPDESKVIPQMQIMLDGFLKIYEKVGGVGFIKQYTPKQFALFGSGDYDTDGSVKGGTADGGRRITLYGLNGLDITNPNAVAGNLGVVHHEFTHILNQTRLIPPDFEKICVGDYYANWTNSTQNSVKISRELGFISPYSRKSVGEDFAETVATLLVSGQLDYNNYAYNSGAVAYGKMKQKEVLARDYMTQFFNINLTDLQLEFHRLMKDKYNSADYEMTTAFDNFAIGGFDLDIRNEWATQGTTISAKQKALLDPILDELGGWSTKTMKLNVLSDTSGVLLIGFGDANNNYTAAYDLTFAKQNDGSYAVFKSATQGTGTIYNNGNAAWVIRDVQPFLDYLASTTFNLDWAVSTAEMTAANYLKLGKFQDKNDASANLLSELITKKY